MPFKLPENTHETTTTAGTGTYDLTGAVAQHFPFSQQMTSGDTTLCVVTDGASLECGLYTFNSAGAGTLARTAIWYSTDGNNPISWGSGTRNIFAGLPGVSLKSLIDPTAANGLFSQTSQNTYARRSIAVGSGLSVQNADGVAGNPTILQNLIPLEAPMVFYMLNAPTGWVQVPGLGNRALRIVEAGTSGGSGGGGAAFSSIFNNTLAVSSVALTVAQLPPHNHSFTTGYMNQNTAHSHPYSIPMSGVGSSVHSPGWPGRGDASAQAATYSGNTNVVDTNHVHSGATDNNGSGGVHSHTLNLNLQYLDIILCKRLP